MSERLGTLDVAHMTDEQRELYRRFTTGPRADPSSPFSLVDADGHLTGPPSLWVRVPTLGRALEQLGMAVRFHATLPPRAREIVILMVGHHHRCAFELYAHLRAARAAGFTDAELTALAEGRFEPRDEVERVAHRVTRQLLDTGTLSDAAYREARAVLSTEELAELVTLAGFYTMVAFQLNAFAITPPAE